MTGAESSPRLIFDWEKKCAELEAKLAEMTRSAQEWLNSANHWQDRAVLAEAEVERLKSAEGMEAWGRGLTLRAEKAETEVARLRAALNYILEVDDQQPGLSGMSRLILVKEIASRTLRGGGE